MNLETESARKTGPPTGGGLGYLLMSSAHAWRTSLARRLQPVNLTPSQFFVIATIYHRHRAAKNPLNQRQIAERTGLDINVVSQVVRDLERRGILRRDQHPDDSRAHQVTLSEGGLALAKSSTATARRLNDEFFGNIEGAALAPILEKLTDAI